MSETDSFPAGSQPAAFSPSPVAGTRRQVLRGVGLGAGSAVAMGAMGALAPLRLAAPLMAAGLAGCGFELRRELPLQFSSLALSGFAQRSPLAEAIARQAGRQVQVLPNPQQAEVVLQALEDQRDRSVVASTAAALVREVRLRVRLRFRAHTPGGRELLPVAQLVLVRDMSMSETAALAKANEEDELMRDMQADVVNQVLRRLATIRL